MGFVSNLISGFSKPSIDVDEMIEFISNRVNIDEGIIKAILVAEEEFLREKGVTY